MRLCLLISVAMGLVAAAPTQGVTPNMDQEKIQGTWLVVSGEIGGKPWDATTLAGMSPMKFAGNRLLGQTGQDWVGDQSRGVELTVGETQFRLDPARQPKAMDITTTVEGRVYLHPSDPDPLTIPLPERRLAIYRLESDRLTICYSVGDKRPTKFTTSPKSGTCLLVLERKKK